MIIGVTGTNGAGKGTVVDYLVEKGFIHKSVREFLTEEIKRQGLPEDRNSLRDVANALRKEHGPAYVIEQLYGEAKEEGTNVGIESIRTIGEAEFLQSVGASILAVDADKQVRYERAVTRGSMTDKVSFEEFCAQEDREMASTESWDMNVFGVMKIADFVLTNDGTIEELHAKIDALPIFS
jgi:dephospho-CoA kinase